MLTELKLMGLNFVYLPKALSLIKSLSETKLLTLLSFLYPRLSDKRVLGMVEKLAIMKTSDFTKEWIVGKMGLSGLSECFPSLLLCVNESRVKGQTYVNFLSVTLEIDPINTVRKFVDMFMALYDSKKMIINSGDHGRFAYYGYYKQILDMLAENKSVVSRVVIDTLHCDILLPEIECKLSKLHRREKALYALFLLESSCGGINFSKPETTKALVRFNRRMEIIQTKYEIIYEAFGGSKSNAPKIFLPENRLPMLSLIKQQFRSMSDLLDKWEDYSVKRNIFGNYSVSIPSRLCFCLDSMTMNICQLGESSFWSKLLSL